MNTPQQDPNQTTQTRRAALGGLAVVGFIALILIGIATAIYAASFLPKAFSKLAGANVYLSSLDTGNGAQTGSSNPNVPVSSQPGNSVPLSPATSTTQTQPAPAETTTPAPATTKPANPSYTYTQPTYTYTPPAQTTQSVVVPAQQSYYGLPDLTVTVNSVGYLTRRNDTTSFVSASTIPNGYQGAVRFTVYNRGTNSVGNWNFRADLPSDTDSTYYSAYQRSLNPGDSVVFTLGFDSSRTGSGNVRITVDPYGNVSEANENNNTDSATVYFQNYGYNSNGGSYDSNGNYCSQGTYYSSGRYYCQGTSINNYNGNGSYDSNGNYCPNGTYYSSNRYYCNGYNNNYNNNYGTGQYDSSGNYCSYGTYYSNGRYYCNGGSNNNSGSYDSNGNYCSYGTYYSNGRSYCNDAYSRNYNNSNQYDSNGNYCWAGSYYSNGRTYCN